MGGCRAFPSTYATSNESRHQTTNVIAALKFGWDHGDFFQAIKMSVFLILAFFEENTSLPASWV